jgi:hypothetical protein
MIPPADIENVPEFLVGPGRPINLEFFTYSKLEKVSYSGFVIT